jgi:hypothetical protein
MEAVRVGRLSSPEKFTLAGYWALLTTCTPAWHRNAVEMVQHKLRDFMLIAVGQYFPEDRELVDEVVAGGQLKRDIGHDVKATLTQHITSYAIGLYHQDWTFLKNSTEVPFITSDNPSSIFPSQPLMGRIARFVPLAPDLAIVAVTDPVKMRLGGLISPIFSNHLRGRSDKDKSTARGQCS